ncbi:response regulator transcription factor [Parendozoicomonas haliclonae]|uniref:Bacterial regulatory protein, luxR family n=1 Tax=Parendozoicomonas haliclonae TaxID=1960125 RepID=A0A1X7AGQ5_9GAMM|nr:LuxR C-terminal-related transcriptional regulator [Parendozoicomonas haliclonae]SMA40504.1 Bacterial regulatory protein, luxR family [Parendozoicomonas haliclonae]
MTQFSSNELAFVAPCLQPEPLESLFDLFLSRVDGSGLVSMNLRSVPAGSSTDDLLPFFVDDTISGPRFDFTHSEYVETVDAFNAEYMKSFAADDLNFLQYINARQSFLYNFGAAPKGTHKNYVQHGLKTTLVVPVSGGTRVETHNPQDFWQLRFSFHSVLGNRELERWFSTRKQHFCREMRQLCIELKALHSELFSVPVSPSLHIHDHALVIMKLLAAGYSTKVIADKVELSEKGVEYHLNTMRQKLNAKNRTHLISQAYLYGILTN